MWGLQFVHKTISHMFNLWKFPIWWFPELYKEISAYWTNVNGFADAFWASHICSCFQCNTPPAFNNIHGSSWVITHWTSSKNSVNIVMTIWCLLRTLFCPHPLFLTFNVCYQRIHWAALIDIINALRSSLCILPQQSKAWKQKEKRLGRTVWISLQRMWWQGWWGLVKQLGKLYRSLSCIEAYDRFRANKKLLDLKLTMDPPPQFEWLVRSGVHRGKLSALPASSE